MSNPNRQKQKQYQDRPDTPDVIDEPNDLPEYIDPPEPTRPQDPPAPPPLKAILSNNPRDPNDRLNYIREPSHN